MGNTLETKKFACPVLPSMMLHRETLTELLEAVIVGPIKEPPLYKLVLLQTPAGYGKTTLLADFARRTAIRCCWYFLDRSDSVQTTFLQYLQASIVQCYPQLASQPGRLEASSNSSNAAMPASWRTTLDTLIEALRVGVKERFAIFLCNYHEVNDAQTINNLINYLLQKLPPHGVLVIESRATPDLDFASLISHNLLVGIGSNKLRFTAQDVYQLAQIQEANSLSQAQAEQFATVFDGWIAGILLGTHLGSSQILKRGEDAYISLGPSKIQIDRQNLLAYIVDEVFCHDHLMFTFLRDISILEKIEVALCIELLRIDDAAERLQYLERNGLFVTRNNEGSPSTYSCHPVVRELLYDELRRLLPERFIMLHQHAVAIMRAQGHYERAVYHAFEAQAYDSVFDLIIEIYKLFFTQGRAETLARWIDTLWTVTPIVSPRLLIIRATSYILKGEDSAALPLLQAASTAIANDTTIDGPSIPLLHAEIAIAYGRIAEHNGEYKNAQEIYEGLLKSLTAQDATLQAEIYTRLGVCANLQGDFLAGIGLLQKALQLWGRHNTGRGTAEVYSILASSYSLLGNTALAEHHILRALAYWDQLHDEWGKVDNLIRFGMIKQRQGAVAEAEEAFTQALTQARGPIHFERGQSYALTSLGELYRDQGLFDQSLVTTEEGLALARHLKDKHLTNLALCSLAITYLYMGDAATAHLLFTEIHRHTTNGETTGYQRAICELGYGTVLLYQQRYKEACTCLTQVKNTLQIIGIKRELIQVMLRIAVCQLAQAQKDEFIRMMEEISFVLPACDGCEQLVFMEFRQFPLLQQAVATFPEGKRLRDFFRLETEEHELKTSPRLSTPAAGSSTVQHASLCIRALGEPAVVLDDAPVTRWRMSRAMELFFFLLDCNRPMRKEQIITALWQEADDQMNQTFHSTVHYLRKAIGESCIVTRQGSYSLTLATQYGNTVWYDIAFFQEHYKQAKLSLRCKDTEAAQEHLTAMIQLYRGDYVQSFYSDWCIPSRDKLRLIYIDALRQLAQISYQNEQYAESIVYWQRLLTVDNCQEEAYYGLMQCYMYQGKRELALRQYQQCQETLRSELGLQPGAALQKLYHRLTSTKSTLTKE